MNSKNPTYPDAHPTAPGGMSQKQLVSELVRDTNLTKAQAESLIWREQIEEVIASRKNIEARYKAAHGQEILAEHEGEPVGVVEEALVDAGLDPDDDDDLWGDDDDADDEDDSEYLLVKPEVPKPEPTIEEVADEAEEIVVDVAAWLEQNDEFADYEPPAEKHHADGSVHDQVECFHEEHDQMEDIEALFEELTDARDKAEMEALAHQPPPLFLGLPDTLDFIFDGHAGAGPSGAERWMNCTASLGAIKAFLETLTPNQQHQLASGNTAARQGTTAHSAAAAELGLLLGDLTPEQVEEILLDLTVTPEADEAYDPEMAEWITEYTDFIRTFIDAGHEVLIEERVESVIPLDHSVLGDEPYVITGSVDAGIMPTLTDNVLTAVDLKYGDGIYVDVESNPQVRIYMLGLLARLADEDGNLPDLDRLDYVIVQPRLGGIKTWTESVDDLLAWRDEVLSPALTAALYGPSEGAVFVPGELQCQWCPVRGACAALAEDRMAAGADLFDTIVEAEFNGHDTTKGFPETGVLTNERLATLLTQVESLVKIKDDLKAEAQRRLHRGDKVPGYQLVNYTPPRSWAEDAADKIAGEEVSLTSEQRDVLFKPATLLTPKQALEALKIVGVDDPDAVLDDLIVAPDKRPVVAREGDRRKTWEGTPPEQMFPDLGAGE